LPDRNENKAIAPKGATKKTTNSNTAGAISQAMGETRADAVICSIQTGQQLRVSRRSDQDEDKTRKKVRKPSA
jgi:hypothetical protein